MADRAVEWSWIVANMPSGPGKALDFGCGNSNLALIAARKGFKTTAIDLTPVNFLYVHPDLEYIHTDIFKAGFLPHTFDLIVSGSSIEHVGLVGRYNVKESRPNGDIEAMSELRKLLKPDGEILLTIPVGYDAVFPPLHRVYGQERLPRLILGCTIEKEEFWTKNDSNQWIMTEKSIALSLRPGRDFYGLGCFVLRAGEND
ncbi:class I SAM-dependent methyltransferase [Chloroflexota bacterium]